jgi:hypothetical protein
MHIFWIVIKLAGGFVLLIKGADFPSSLQAPPFRNSSPRR